MSTQRPPETRLRVGRKFEHSDRVEVSRRLGRVIRRARRDLGLTMTDLGRLAEVSRRTIRDIEQGDDYLPSLSTLIPICWSLGLSLAEVGAALDPASTE